MIQQSALHRVHINRNPEHLREEIAFMEARLVAIGYDGDCAYEKAMARYYQEHLAMYRDQLNKG